MLRLQYYRHPLVAFKCHFNTLGSAVITLLADFLLTNILYVQRLQVTLHNDDNETE